MLNPQCNQRQMTGPCYRRSEGRIVMLDVCRLLAAVAVVWIHVPESASLLPWAAISRFAVPFFVAASVLTAFGTAYHHPTRPFYGYLRDRSFRIYLPFLIWSTIYLVARLSKEWILGAETSLDFRLSLLWTGTSAQMWFLPYILVVNLAAFALARVLYFRRSCFVWLTAAGVLVLGVIASIPAPEPIRTLFGWGGVTFYNGWNALPAAVWGACFAIVFQRYPRLRRSTTVALLGLCLLIASQGYVRWTGRSSLFENLAGVGCLMLAMAPWSGNALRRIGALGGLSFGVYLAHMLFVEGFQSVGHAVGIPVSVPFDLVVFALSILGSTALAVALSRTALGRIAMGAKPQGHSVAAERWRAASDMPPIRPQETEA